MLLEESANHRTIHPRFDSVVEQRKTLAHQMISMAIEDYFLELHGRDVTELIKRVFCNIKHICHIHSFPSRE